MSNSIDHNRFPVTLPEIVDQMKEEICLQLRAEIEFQLADFSVKLIGEIKTLLSQSSTMNGFDDKRKSGSLRKKVTLDTLVSSEDIPRASSLDIIPSIGALNGVSEPPVSPEASQTSRRSGRTLRSAIRKDIHKHDKSVVTYLETVTREMRNRNLQDKDFPNNCLVHLVLSTLFKALSFSAIIANTVWMVYETDNQSYRNESTWHDGVNLGFALVFMAELLLRIVALQKYFVFGEDWAWNLLDSTLVLASIPELFVSSMNLSVIRIVRLIRLTKALRLIRLLKFFTSLREILLSLFTTLGSLFWSFVALGLIVYISALMFMQWITLQREQGLQYSDEVLFNFRSTWNSMQALFSMMSGGQDWFELAAVFDGDSDYVSKNALMLYVFFTTFGLVNVIVGVFVARATDAGNADEQLRVAKEEEQRSRKVKDLIRIFNELDAEHEGAISKEHFHTFFEKSHNQGILRSHGLQLFDLNNLWKVMLPQGASDGLMDLPDFIIGMMRLSGNAKSTELVMLSARIAEMDHAMKRNERKLDNLFSGLSFLSLDRSSSQSDTRIGV